MSVNITISTNTAEEARRELRGLLVGEPPALTVSVLHPEAEGAEPPANDVEPKKTCVEAVTESEKADAETAPSKRHRRTKAEMAAARAAETAPAESAEDTDTTDQDGEDEAADPANDVKAATAEAVRSELTEYVKKFGIAAAQEDGVKLFTALFGSEVTKVSQIPNTPEALAKAVEGVRSMTEENPFKREAVA